MKSLAPLAVFTIGLVLIGMGLKVVGWTDASRWVFGVAWFVPGLILCVGVVLLGVTGQVAKAQGAAHGEAKRAGEGVGP